VAGVVAAADWEQLDRPRCCFADEGLGGRARGWQLEQDALSCGDADRGRVGRAVGEHLQEAFASSSVPGAHAADVAFEPARAEEARERDLLGRRDLAVLHPAQAHDRVDE
jgi:hypothetical protein